MLIEEKKHIVTYQKEKKRSTWWNIVFRCLLGPSFFETKKPWIGNLHGCVHIKFFAKLNNKRIIKTQKL